MRKLLISSIVSILLLLAALGLMLLSRPGVDRSAVGRLSIREKGGPEPEETVAALDAAGEDASGSNAAEADAGSGQVPQGAALHGRVSDERGNGIPGAAVYVKASSDVFSDRWDRNRVLRERLLGRSEALAAGLAARAETDSGGMYSIPIAAIPRGKYQVLARHGDYVPQWEAWTWVPEPSELNFVLGPGDTISGRVLGPDGTPVEGAVVEAFQEAGEDGRWGGGGEQLAERDATDAEGKFRLGVAGGRFSIVARARGYSRGEATSVDAGTQNLEIALGEGRNLSGRVLTEDGKAIPEAIVLVFSMVPQEGDLAGGVGRFGGRGGPFAGGGGRGGFRGMPAELLRFLRSPEGQALSDAKGRFQLSDLGPGRYLVHAKKGGLVPDEKEIDLSAELKTTQVDITMRPGKILAGTVSDPSGQPVRGAFVALGADRGEGEGAADSGDRRRGSSLFRAAAAVETDRSGRFRFDTIRAGTYSLGVQAEDFVQYRRGGIQVADDPVNLEIVLSRGIRLQGRVLSSADGSPVPGARVRLRLNGDDLRQAESDAEGKYWLGGLSAGRAEPVEVDAKGFCMLVAEGLEISAEPEVQDKDFRIGPSAVLSGIVTDARGAPVQGARATVAPVLEESGGDDRRAVFMGRMRQWAQTTQGRTNGEGKFTLTEVNAGPALQLSIWHPDFKTFTSDAFAVKPGDRLENLKFVLIAGGRLEAWVRGSEGTPVPGARVRIELEREPAPAGTESPDGAVAETDRRRRGPGGAAWGDGARGAIRTSGPDGKTVFAGLEAGSYGVVCRVRGQQPFQARVSVQDEQITTLAVDLLPENVIQGTIQDLAAAPVPGVWIEAFVDGASGWMGEPSTARSDDAGAFTVGSLGEGPYSIRFRRNGFAEQTLAGVQVNTEVAVVLERLGGISGSVLAAETGAPIQAFVVLLLRAGQSPRDARGRGWGGFPGGGDRLQQDFNDPTGAFALEGVPPGDYKLQVTSQGLYGAEVAVQVEDGMVSEGVRVLLSSGVSLTGVVVVQGTAEPVAGAEVFLLPLTDGSAGSETGQDRRDRGEDRRERREERRSGRLEEREVTDSPASRIAQAMAAAAVKGGNVLAATDDRGAFELKEVPTGPYLLVVNHESLVPARQKIEIREGMVLAPLRIDLKKGEELSGVVTFGSGFPASGILVSLRDSRGLSRRTVTDRAGRYAVGGLEEDTYYFSVRGAEGSRAAPVRVKIDKGSNRLDYRIEEGRSAR